MKSAWLLETVVVSVGKNRMAYLKGNIPITSSQHEYTYDVEEARKFKTKAEAELFATSGWYRYEAKLYKWAG